ncbi:MAG: cysteine-rich CWC family protein [Rubrivivax sp.]
MNASAAPADSRCPRCGGAFHCGARDAAPCACSTLVLPPALLAELRQRHSGCLCLPCLRQLAAAAQAAPGSPDR